MKMNFKLMGGALLLTLAATTVFAGTQFNTYEDAAVALAKEWQAGGKARVMISSDGMVIFPFGQKMPKLTCSPTRACDVQMQPGEKVRKVILGDGVNWTWDAADSIENGLAVQHVVFQPRDSNVESNVIITTDRRTYHIKLYAPKEEGVYLNRVGFYYPQELVASWASKMGAEAKVQAKEESMNVTAYVDPLKMDRGYRIEGKADFQPVVVFNDGQRVYMEMPDSLRSGDHPTLHLLDDKDRVMVVNYRRHEDETTGKVHYIVDTLFSRAELVSGSEKVRIIWKKKEKSFWGGSGGNSSWFGLGN